MNNALKFAALDFRTLLPYFTRKNMLLFAAALVLNAYSLGFKAIPYILSFMLLTIGSYTFSISEVSNTDCLYTQLGIRRKTVVSGRFLGVVIADILVLTLATLLSVCVAELTLTPYVLKELCLAFVIAFYFVSLTQFVQYTGHFALGYQKGRVAVMLPVFAFLAIVGLLFESIKDEEFFLSLVAKIVANPSILIIPATAIWLFVLFVTHQISIKKYQARDF